MKNGDDQNHRRSRIAHSFFFVVNMPGCARSCNEHHRSLKNMVGVMSVETTNTMVPLAPHSLRRKEPDVFEFKPENETNNAKPVYHALAKHQVQEESWEFQELAAWLQLWTKRFNQEFQLGLSEISLCIEWLSIYRLGHFRHGTNGFGLKGEIAINQRHLESLKPWEILGVLLHELVHAWQEIYGKPGKNNYHNNQFREKARDFGLIINTKGQTQYEPKSPFFEVLNKYGVETPAIPPVIYVTGQGKSKLKKWSCQCEKPINVRVATPHFYARCLWCGELFELQEL